MFDFAGSEILLIGIVALVAIGPKDLPVAIKAVSTMVKKARRMAGEFQTHVDEMVREADLGEMRSGFNDLRKMDIKGQIMRAVDGDGSIRSSLSKPDFTPKPPPVPVHDSVAPQAAIEPETPAPDAAIPDTAVPGSADLDRSVLAEVLVAPVPQPSVAVSSEPAPAFVPPRYAPAPAVRPARVPPAFIPPAAAAAALSADHG